jgi:L-lactate dehydrogenase complex protein LldG
VLSVVPGIPSTVAIPADPHALADLSLFVCQAALGVAENGAVWIATNDAWYRAALFLAERVVIVLAESTIVSDLHEAYARLDIRAKSFGALVAGPSKTADIEQALVIGAHGPKELTLIVVT